MMNSQARFVLLSLLLLGGTYSVGAQEIDCAKKGTAMQDMICSDMEVYNNDRRVERRYRALLKENGSPAAMREAYQAWIAKRDVCRTIDCLRTVYRERVAELRVIERQTAEREVARGREHGNLPIPISSVGATSYACRSQAGHSWLIAYGGAQGKVAVWVYSTPEITPPDQAKGLEHVLLGTFDRKGVSVLHRFEGLSSRPFEKRFELAPPIAELQADLSQVSDTESRFEERSRSLRAKAWDFPKLTGICLRAREYDEYARNRLAALPFNLFYGGPYVDQATRADAIRARERLAKAMIKAAEMGRACAEFARAQIGLAEGSERMWEMGQFGAAYKVDAEAALALERKIAGCYR